MRRERLREQVRVRAEVRREYRQTRESLRWASRDRYRQAFREAMRETRQALRRAERRLWATESPALYGFPEARGPVEDDLDAAGVAFLDRCVHQEPLAVARHRIAVAIPSLFAGLAMLEQLHRQTDFSPAPTTLIGAAKNVSSSPT